MVSKVAKLVKDSSQDKRRRIEAAALALFTTQGFHGTNNREIAKRAGVSTAAIYTHYPSKEALFTGLVEQHRALVAKWLRKTIAGLRDPLAKPDLTAFASAIRAKMRKDPEYFLLIFIDVVEFKNQHFRASFHDVPEWFRRALGPVLANVSNQPGWCGQDPAFVLAAVYMYFVHYGLIEQHMGGRGPGPRAAPASASRRPAPTGRNCSRRPCRAGSTSSAFYPAACGARRPRFRLGSHVPVSRRQCPCCFCRRSPPIGPTTRSYGSRRRRSRSLPPTDF